MSPPPEFERYDESLALSLGGQQHPPDDGLPGFLGIRNVEMGPGRMVAEVDVRPELMNPFGTAHGGVVASLVDHVLGAVLYPVIEKGAWAATTEFKVNLTAPVREGTLRATSTVEVLTRRSAVVRIEVENDGRVAALAQGTVTIVAPKA